MLAKHISIMLGRFNHYRVIYLLSARVHVWLNMCWLNHSFCLLQLNPQFSSPSRYPQITINLSLRHFSTCFYHFHQPFGGFLINGVTPKSCIYRGFFRVFPLQTIHFWGTPVPPLNFKRLKGTRKSPARHQPA